MASDRPITAQQAADLLIVSARVIYRLIESGELAGRKVGNKYRTTEAACIAYLKTRAILSSRTRVNIKEKFYVNHPQGRRVALSFLYAVRKKS
ncbi:helix-turn-helix domain-containing protein [Klebsiella pneumoniae]